METENFEEVTKPAYSYIFRLLRKFFPGKSLTKVKHLLESSHYLYDNDEVSQQFIVCCSSESIPQVYNRAEECYSALSLKLGDNKYFFGEQYVTVCMRKLCAGANAGRGREGYVVCGVCAWCGMWLRGCVACGGLWSVVCRECSCGCGFNLASVVSRFPL